LSGEPKRGLFGRWFGRQEKPTEEAPAPETPEAKTEAAPSSEPAPETPVAPEMEPPPAPAEPAAKVVEAPAEATAALVPEPAPVAEAPKKTSWFQRLREGLQKTSSKLSDGIAAVFTKRKLDADTLEDLEDLLIQADLGVETSMRITEAISKGRYEKGISADDVRTVLAQEVERVLAPVAKPLQPDFTRKPHVVLVVGVNGSGKTTTIGKIAQKYVRDGRNVMMAAGDTFRAAAIDQLKVWGERTGAKVIARDVGADSSGLAFDALKEAREGAVDLLLVDTAGRLQNKAALMDELEKVVRVMRKLDPTAPHDVLLVLDATTGQNALSQVEVFRQRAGVTGLIMTKLDGTARGGILVAISAKHGLPVHAVGVGEGVDDLQAFDAGEFARAIALN
jgi:fused signal recognition particle receptor